MKLLHEFYAYAKEYEKGTLTARDLIRAERRLYEENGKIHTYSLENALCWSVFGDFEQLNEYGGDEGVLDRLAREFIHVMEGRHYYCTSGRMTYYLHDRCFSEEQRAVLRFAASVSGNNRPLTAEEYRHLRPYKRPDPSDTVPDLLTSNITSLLRAGYEYQRDHQSEALDEEVAKALRDSLEMADGAPLRLYMSYKPTRFFAAIL